MATFSDQHASSVQTTQIRKPSDTHTKAGKIPAWFCLETGIYKSKHSSIHLPSDPFLDVVSLIFSYPHNGQLAIIDSSSGFSIHYSQLLPLITSMAAGLQEMGISKGDVVLFLLPTSIYFPIVLLGVLYIGAIVKPMNPLSTFSEVKRQTVGGNISLAFVTAESVEKLVPLCIRTVEVPLAEPIIDMTEFGMFRKLISTNPKLISRPRISQDDVAAIMCSSGTTGATKGVILTHRNLIATVELFVRFEASQYKDEISWTNVYLVPALPMFHIYGLAHFVMGLFSLGTSVVVMRKFDVHEAVRAIQRYKVTQFPIVPPMLTVLTQKIRDTDHESITYYLRSLKQVSCGAACSSRKSIDEFVRSIPQVDFIQGYGMTETAAVGTRGFNTESFQKHYSAGLLAPNTEAKVVDWITGVQMPPGKEGELWLRGPGIMKGYLNDPKATESSINEDGWLRTGDIVYFDEDGYLYIVDRLKDVIKYKGFQIAPADLEIVLLSHPDVVDAAVAGVGVEVAGEIPVAFIVKKPGSTLSEEEIMVYTAKEVAPYKKVRKVVFLSSIPKSPAGKVLRRQLRDSVMFSKL